MQIETAVAGAQIYFVTLDNDDAMAAGIAERQINSPAPLDL